MTDNQKIQKIRTEIQMASKEIRKKFPILDHQDAIGFSFFIFSALMITGSGMGYLHGSLPAWFVIIWVAFWTSLLHELEHDLIHFQYFKNRENFFNQALYQFMMLGVWVFRPMTINPWLRRIIHFHHHRVAGTRTDVEERGVTNGERWGLWRLLTTGDIFLGGVVRSYHLNKDIIAAVRSGELSREQANLFRIVNLFGMLPFTIPLYFVWYVFLFQSFTGGSSWVGSQMFWINPLIVILIAPNLLRMFCLHLVTSNMHYYGDVESGNVLQQTQVLNHRAFWPLQFFCFNFGSTHAIHHFVVNEPFYIRQLSVVRSHQVMKENGVRFNDLGSFVRANRFLDSCH